MLTRVVAAVTDLVLLAAAGAAGAGREHRTPDRAALPLGSASAPAPLAALRHPKIAGWLCSVGLLAQP